MNSALFTWIVLPALIMIARIGDVTIGTIRIIFVSKGKKALASSLGFFEVLIWLIAIGQIMQHLNNFACYIGYAVGFATGNFIGITVEEKLAMGTLVVRIFASNGGAQLIHSLKAAGFGVTAVEGSGATGPVNVIYTFINRRALAEVDRIIKEFNPKAFYCVEEIKSVNAGIFPGRDYFFKSSRVGLIRRIYKRK
ncbi:MAG: DUF2179 domain-containing protein [Bacillota bacterium]